MAKKTHEKMLIPGPKGNANQKHIKIPPYSCYHQEHYQQQMLGRM
jgi:hypothetical protein